MAGAEYGKRKMKKEYTFRTLVVRNLMIGYAAILLLIAVFLTYEIRLARESILDAAEGTASLYLQELQRQMEIVEERDLSWFAQNHTGIILEQSSDELRSYQTAYGLKQQFDELVARDDFISVAFVFYDDMDNAMYSAESSFNDDEISQLKTLAANRLQTSRELDEWDLLQSGSSTYLVHLFGSNTVVLGEVFDFLAVTDTMTGDGTADAIITYADRKKALTNQETAQELGIPFTDSESSYESRNTTCTRYTVVDKKLYLYVATAHTTGLMRQAGYVFAILLLVVTLLSAVLSYRFFRKDMILPLHTMYDTLTIIGSGQEKVRMEEHPGLKEYGIFSQRFNEMMEQIQSLKIASYEEKLSREKVLLQLLRFQIEPHFYLNSLTTIFALSRQKKYDLMENNILIISDYIRYSFRNDFVPVPLSDEVKFAEDTYKLRKSSRSYDIAFRADIDQELMHLFVLPFCIQTFVENSMKYAAPAGATCISVRAQRLVTDEEDILNLTISDDGPGYPEKWLDMVNSDQDFPEEEKHVGLFNLKKRLKLEYGDTATIYIRNDHGAVSEIIYAINKEKKG